MRKVLARESGRENPQSILAQKRVVLVEMLPWQEALRSERPSAPLFAERRRAAVVVPSASKRIPLSLKQAEHIHLGILCTH